MSAQVDILQLPAAGSITGSESVPIVQNGVTVRTTTAAVAGSPVQTQTFLTVNQEATLANSRYVGVTNGLAITDAGAQGLFNISPTGALSSLVNSGTGFQVKTSSTALTGRSIAVTGVGLAITNGTGVSGNPTIALDGQALNLANYSGTGLLTVTGAGAISATSILGTTNEIGITNGNASGGSPTVALASDPILPGTGSVTVPIGTTAQRSTPVNGMLRYNTTLGSLEVYASNAWGTITSGVGVSGFSTTLSGLTPATNTTGAIVLAGTLGVSSGGTGTSTPALVAGTNITVSGSWPNQTINATGTGSVTSVATGVGLTGGPITTTGTIALDNTAVTPGTYTAANITVDAQGRITAAANGSGGGGGTVTSIAATVPAFLSITGSPITTSGTLAITLSGSALPVVNGGTGTTTPALVAGTNISISGTWPNQTINSTGSGDVAGPASATDNAITRFDATTGKIVQNSLVTIADDGAITAPVVGSMIPFYYANQAAFPAASASHGALAHSHADGAMFFAHGGVWTRLLDAGATVTVAQGGTGATTLSGYMFGNGTSAVTASTTIPNTAITGLGTMSTQSAGAVAITGGTINGTSIGATTTSTGNFTTVTATTGIFGGTF